MDQTSHPLPAVDPLAEAPLTERKLRALPTAVKWFAVAALVAMSGFHLWTGTAGEFTADIQRPVHLAFAAGLALLMFPLLSRCDRPWLLGLDVVLALLAVGAALYRAVMHEELAQRSGMPTTLDLVVAGVGVALVLEPTRRSVSPALFWVTLAFLAYALFGHVLPGDYGHSPLSLRQVLNHQYYTAEGVFGIPLEVSSTFVFLFVLFGAALERSGAGQYLIDAAFATMGRFRGGPAKAAVAASALMGTVSGSSIANTVTTGSLTIPLMKKAGFKPHVAGAVEVAASTNGQLMPPVMGAAAFIMAQFTEIPYGTIVIAAAIPALLSYLAIFSMIHFEAVRTGVEPGDPKSLPALGRTLLRGLHLNLPFVALLVFLLGLWTTPSYAASRSIWVTFALFLLVCLIAPATAYGVGASAGHSIRQRGRHFLVRTGQALRDGALNMLGIACACACCGIIIGVVTQTGLPGKLTTIIQRLSDGNLLTALLLTAGACIVLGIGLPTTATYIIMASLTAPAILEIAAPGQADVALPLMLATHLFVFYYGILADDTPPVGLCAYAAAGIAGSDPIRTGLTSFRFDLAAFLLPLVFFFNPELLLQEVTWVQVLWVLPGAAIGMICFAAALQGYAWDRLPWWQRGLMLVTAFLLVKPTLWMTLAGLGLLLVVYVTGRLARRGVVPA